MLSCHVIARISNSLRNKLLHSIGNQRFTSSIDWKNAIYALSSGSGKCGVAVIRVSGSETANVVKKMTKLGSLPKPRNVCLSNIYNPQSNEHLDKALVLWFPGPYSFTGEDVCEFHIHGGNAVISSVLRALSELPGLKHAEAGEFTKRAFLNGKLDLTEVEGLGDLIHSETEEQRKQALKQMDGRLKMVIQSWSKTLLHCLAHLEAYIDFGEDQHIDDDVIVEVQDNVTCLGEKIQKHLNDKRRGERLRSGVKLAIIGKPNVGKSSLLNLITAKPTAIVSSIAGTTRDVLESAIDIDGFPVIINDTAGIRDTIDQVEGEGVRRAKLTAAAADIIVYVVDSRELVNRSTPGYIQDIKGQLECDDIESQQALFIINKSDLLVPSDVKILTSCLANHLNNLSYAVMSCSTEEGFVDFLKILSSVVRTICLGDDPSQFSPSLTQERHRAHVTNCMQELNRCCSIIDTDVVIAAEHLRLALNYLGKITGKMGAEDILNVIFRDFCIGK